MAATDLEALLRRTLGALFVRGLGADWQQSALPVRIQTALKRTRERARENREGVPEDPWLSAGLSEIRAVAEHVARRRYEQDDTFASTDPNGLIVASLKDLGWDSVAQCRADFERLLSDRHETAHPGVVEPLAGAQRDEAEAIRRRLRLGAERVRRRLITANEEWFPYIETVHCPGIEGWEYQRGGSFPTHASLVEGDEIEFIVSAVNTDGSTAGLRYGLQVQPDGGSFVPVIGNQPSGVLRCTASPPGRNVIFRVTVAGTEGGHDVEGIDDDATFIARVKPAG